jgi:hypothetical protein
MAILAFPTLIPPQRPITPLDQVDFVWRSLRRFSHLTWVTFRTAQWWTIGQRLLYQAVDRHRPKRLCFRGGLSLKGGFWVDNDRLGFQLVAHHIALKNLSFIWKNCRVWRWWRNSIKDHGPPELFLNDQRSMKSRIEIPTEAKLLDIIQCTEAFCFWLGTTIIICSIC